MAHLVWTILCLSLLCAGCAGLPEQELAAARASLAQAHTADAPRLAPAAYAAAARTLQEGEELVRAGDYDQARRLLPLAASQARHARTLAADARDLEEQTARLRQEQESPSPEPPARTKPRKTKPKPPPSPAEPTPAPPPPLPSPSYEVGEGETLWAIAAEPQVYGDPLLWPLLYQANRDQIKDPRQVYPGQTLKIPRELTGAELEEAREKARISDIFPARELLAPTTP